MACSFSKVGKGIPIRDAVLKVTGELEYIDDLKLPHMLYGKILFSPIAHARIKHIDTSEAESLKGVKAVATYLNAPGKSFNSALRFAGHDLPRDERIFDRTVRFVGDRVAAVAAEDPEIAQKAIKLIRIEYEELPAVFDPEEAVEDDAPRVHPAGNIITKIINKAGDVEKGFAEADLVFEDKYQLPPVHHGAIEMHGVLAKLDSRGKLTIWSSSQNVFAHRLILAQLFDLPLNKVRVIKSALGGAFGGKLELTVEPVAALLAKLSGKPVKLILNRKECMVSTRTRHGAVINLKTGVKKDGTITAQEFKVLTNAGAYCTGSLNVLGAMSHIVFQLYRTPNMCFEGRTVYTNSPIAGAMRGFGSPQVFLAQQLQLNKIAKSLALDMVELQLKNLVRPEDRDPLYNQPMGNPRPIDCVKEAAKIFNWYDKNISQDAGRFKRGIGMAVGAHGNGCFGAHRDYSALALKLNEDGSALLLTGTHDMGNGAVTVQTQIIGEILGLNPEQIECVEADTDSTPWNLGDYASRATFVTGNAALKVAKALVREIVAEGAKLLGEDENNLYYQNGWVYDKQGRKRASLIEVISHAQGVSQRELMAVESYASISGPSSYGAHFAEVEVDTLTGQIRVLNYVAVHDVGKAINPLSVEGQIAGGIQMGLGYGLREALELNEKGAVINSNFKKYKMFKAREMPCITFALIEKGGTTGPFGAKSIGECATVPSAPAVVNAVCNALRKYYNKIPLSKIEI